jgi:hypothetical protein
MGDSQPKTQIQKTNLGTLRVFYSSSRGGGTVSGPPGFLYFSTCMAVCTQFRTCASGFQRLPKERL